MNLDKLFVSYDSFLKNFIKLLLSSIFLVLNVLIRRHLNFHCYFKNFLSSLEEEWTNFRLLPKLGPKKLCRKSLKLNFLKMNLVNHFNNSNNVTLNTFLFKKLQVILTLFVVKKGAKSFSQNMKCFSLFIRIDYLVKKVLFVNKWIHVLKVK